MLIGLKCRDWAIASEVPVFLKLTKLPTLLGHIDLLVYKDGVLYVCDYKPDQLPFTRTRFYESFINSIPQIATYALVLRQMFKLKDVKCVTFNKKGAWLYDPLATLKEITYFMLNNRESTKIPWLPYVDYLT